MKKISALVILAVLAACGGEPPAQEASVAKEALLGAPEGVFNAGAPGYTSNPASLGSWIQQVPIGTFINGMMDQSMGTRYDFNRRVTSTLMDGATHDIAGAQNDDFRLFIDSTTADGTADPTNNIQCTIDLAGVFTTSGPNPGLGMYFPSAMNLPVSNGTAMYASTQGGSIASFCNSLQAGAWHNRSIARVFVEYLPVRNSKPTGPTAAAGAPTGLFVRVDVNFPESGVTNRYFFKSGRTVL